MHGHTSHYLYYALEAPTALYSLNMVILPQAYYPIKAFCPLRRRTVLPIYDSKIICLVEYGHKITIHIHARVVDTLRNDPMKSAENTITIVGAGAESRVRLR